MVGMAAEVNLFLDPGADRKPRETREFVEKNIALAGNVVAIEESSQIKADIDQDARPPAARS